MALSSVWRSDEVSRPVLVSVSMVSRSRSRVFLIGLEIGHFWIFLLLDVIVIEFCNLLKKNTQLTGFAAI